MEIKPYQEKEQAETDSTGTRKKIYVILNPIAGNSSAEEIRQTLEAHCSELGWEVEIYETTGKENVAEVTRTACQRGAELVIAAGGDGTVAGVVNGLRHTGVPLGIIPVGTGNGLARALRIPLEVQEAVRLITDEPEIMDLDALQVGEAYYILNVSAGISSQAMRKTEPEQKRRFGILAYVWTIARQLAGYEPHRFNLSLDGHQVQVRATEILVSNGTLLDEPPFPLGPPEYFNDGQFDVYILTARNLLDYLRLAWYLLLDRKSRNRELRKYTVNDRIFIDAVGRPQPVQADGELIGQTPVEIGLVTDAVRAIVPPLSQDV